MKCEEVQDLLLDHLEGELDPENERLVVGHLAACAACAREREDLEEVLSAVKGPEEMETPTGYHEHFYTRLRARMEEEGIVPGATVPLTIGQRLHSLLSPRVAAGAVVAAGALLLIATSLWVTVHPEGPGPAVEIAVVDADVALALEDETWVESGEPLLTLSTDEWDAVSDRLREEMEGDLAGAFEPEALALSPITGSVGEALDELDSTERETLENLLEEALSRTM